MECASRSVPVAAALSPAVAVAHLTCKEIDRVHAFTLADATAATCSRLRNAEDEAERWREEEWGTISLRLHPLSNPVTPWDWDTKPTFIPIAIVPSKTLQIFLPQKRTLSGAPHKFPDPRPKMLHDPETELPTLRLNLWNAETALWGGGGVGSRGLSSGGGEGQDKTRAKIPVTLNCCPPSTPGGAAECRLYAHEHNGIYCPIPARVMCNSPGLLSNSGILASCDATHTRNCSREAICSQPIYPQPSALRHSFRSSIAPTLRFDRHRKGGGGDWRRTWMDEEWMSRWRMIGSRVWMNKTWMNGVWSWQMYYMHLCGSCHVLCCKKREVLLLSTFAITQLR